jgi:hypothetical protein
VSYVTRELLPPLQLQILYQVKIFVCFSGRQAVRMAHNTYANSIGLCGLCISLLSSIHCPCCVILYASFPQLVYFTYATINRQCKKSQLNNSHIVCTIGFLGKLVFGYICYICYKSLSKQTLVIRLTSVIFTASRWETSGQYLCKFTAPTTWQLPKSDQRISTTPSVRMRLYRSSCTRSRKFNVIYSVF